MSDDKFLYKDESYEINGALFEVYRVMGSGFLESVYQECLENEFVAKNIPFESQPELSLRYKDAKLKQLYRPDFVCYDKIIIEIKAVKELGKEHEAQIINYLKATKMKLGFLVNFGSYPSVKIKRFVY